MAEETGQRVVRQRMTSAQRRAEIVRVAQESFLRRSYASTTIREIAKAAGVNQAMVYKHFASKAELLEESIIVPTAHLRASVFDLAVEIARAGLRCDDREVRSLEVRLYEIITEAFPIFATLLYADPNLGRQSIGPYWLTPFQRATSDLMASAEGRILRYHPATTQNLLVAIIGANLGRAFHKAFIHANPAEDARQLEEISTLLTSGLLVDSNAPPQQPSRTKAIEKPSRPSPASARVANRDETAAGKDTSRTALISAATDLFITQGWKAATVKKITARAGVTEPTLYRYMGSKENLFEQAMFDPLEDVVANIANLGPLFRNAPTKESRVPLGIRVNAELFKAFKTITPLLAVALFSDQDRGTIFYRNQLLPHLDHISLALNETMSPLARKLVEPNALMQMMFGMHLTAATFNLFGETLGDDTGLANVFSMIISFGVQSLGTVHEAVADA